MDSSQGPFPRNPRILARSEDLSRVPLWRTSFDHDPRVLIPFRCFVPPAIDSVARLGGLAILTLSSEYLYRRRNSRRCSLGMIGQTQQWCVDPRSESIFALTLSYPFSFHFNVSALPCFPLRAALSLFYPLAFIFGTGSCRHLCLAPRDQLLSFLSGVLPPPSTR